MLHDAVRIPPLRAKSPVSQLRQDVCAGSKHKGFAARKDDLPAAHLEAADPLHSP